MTRLSVIIPGYNTLETQWRRCLDSVRVACGPNDEIICVDDGSSKHPEFLRDIANDDTRVKIIFLDVNVGQAAARNKGIEVASGEYVVFADSDDTVLPDVYDSAVQIADMNSSDIVLFGVRTIWQKDGLYRESIPRNATKAEALSTESLKELTERQLFDVVCNKVYRKSFIDANRIRFPVGICPGEDTMFALSCICHRAKWSMLDKVGYAYYRLDGTSLSSYKPNLINTLQYWKREWDLYLTTVGKGYDGWWPTMNYSEKWVVLQQWDNIWMKGSDVSVLGRWRYLIANKHYFDSCVCSEFLTKLLQSFIRQNLYFRPIRRWRIKRIFADVKELK